MIGWFRCPNLWRRAREAEVRVIEDRRFFSSTIYCEACGDIVRWPSWQEDEEGRIIFRGCSYCAHKLYGWTPKISS
jgi:hypothetical protein